MRVVSQRGVMTVKPMYLRIREDLMRNLREKQVARLPSEREICRQYGVCRPTVHKALSYFLEKNMIVRRPGKGTFFREEALRDTPATTQVKLVIRHDWRNTRGDYYFGMVTQGLVGGLNAMFDVSIEKYSERLKFDLLQAPHIASVWLSPEQEELNAIAELADVGHFTVVINRPVNHPGVYWVSSDHESEGRLALSYALKKGYSNITYFYPETGKNIFEARDRGIKENLPAKVTYDAVAFDFTHWRDLLTECLSDETKNDRENGIWFLNSGTLLPELIIMLDKYKKTINADIPILVFGDSLDAEKLGVTVVRQQVELLGRLAATIIAEPDSRQPSQSLSCEIVNRDFVK